MRGYPFIAEKLWESDDVWAAVVDRWSDAGFEEIVVYHPAEWGMPAESVTPGVFERAFASQG